MLWINILLLLLGCLHGSGTDNPDLHADPVAVVMKTFGVDPVHFGMIMMLNLGIGLLTPPVGPTIVVGCASAT